LGEKKCGVNLGKKCGVKKKRGVKWREVVTCEPLYTVTQIPYTYVSLNDGQKHQMEKTGSHKRDYARRIKME